ncbi:chromate efflux transporter [Alexandriicola marinus]|uniref:chromate efflux transporter n=1 Tax=Alexandriicola marinus TaxID=2081710 RepID=UPI0030B83752
MFDPETGDEGATGDAQSGHQATASVFVIMSPDPQPVSLGRLARAFGRIGLLSFGGPAAQIALMHRVLVDEEAWITERDFTAALGFCMMLPGPEAMQLATYAGWRLRGTAGGLIAGTLFVLPGALIIFALAAAYAAYGTVPLVESLFLGIKAAVLVIVVQALIRLTGRALPTVGHKLAALLAFAAIFVLALPFPLVLLFGAVWGVTRARRDDARPAAKPVRFGQTLRTVILGVLIWAGPLALVTWATGSALLGEIALFFSWLAVVTFGGAYAVLAYMAQEVVAGQGWISAGQMFDGLGLAETTPGPLILVTQFVGYLAGHGTGGAWMGVLAGLVTLWATFAPCFVWIFAGAPYLDQLGASARLRGAMEGITAVVVGVILNLSVWFALHVTFAEVARTGPVGLWWPDWSTLDWRVPILAALSAVLVFRLRIPIWGLLPVAGICGALLGGI